MRDPIVSVLYRQDLMGIVPVKLESIVLLTLESSEWQDLTVKSKVEMIAVEERKARVNIRVFDSQ